MTNKLKKTESFSAVVWKYSYLIGETVVDKQDVSLLRRFCESGAIV